jgi:hypothetical protein
MKKKYALWGQRVENKPSEALSHINLYNISTHKCNNILFKRILNSDVRELRIGVKVILDITG